MKNKTKTHETIKEETLTKKENPRRKPEPGRTTDHSSEQATVRPWNMLFRDWNTSAHNSPGKTRVRAALRVSSPADPAEREADRETQQAVSMKEADISAEQTADVQASPASGGIGVSTEVESGINSLSGGQQLSNTELSFFGPRLGADFSGVRVHNTDQAHSLADSINARAFTRGSDIVFAKGEYAPGTGEGKKLLAHELVHVVQGGKTIHRKKKLGSLSWHEKHVKGSWEKYSYDFHDYTYHEWLTFLKSGSDFTQSIQLSIFMAAAIGEPKTVFSDAEVYFDFKEVEYQGPASSELTKSAVNLMKAMLISKDMILPRTSTTFLGNTFVHGHSHSGAALSFGPLFRKFSQKYMLKAMRDLEVDGKSREMLNERISNQVPGIGSKEIVESTSEIAISLIRSIMDIKVNKKARGTWLALCERVYFLGFIAGRAMQMLAKIELRKVDDVGDLISIALDYLPGGKMAYKLLYTIISLGTDAWTDTYKTISDEKLAEYAKNKSDPHLTELMKEIDSLHRSEAEIEAIYGRVYAAICSYKEGISDGRIIK